MWHFDGHTDSFFARSLDTTEPRWSVLVTGDWSAYCGANCWRSDVIGSNKISHTHTLINIPAITHTLTRAQIPYLAARWNAILFTSSHSSYLSPASYLTFYILHDTAIILTPRYYAALWGRGQSTLAPSRWYNNGTRWQWTLDWCVWRFSCTMHLFIMHCVHHWKMSRVNFVKKV